VNFLWVRVRDAIAGALDGMTLADLVPLRPRPVDFDLPDAHPLLAGAVSRS
jgi:DNA-binding IscR family transcriptional regulator